MPGRCLPVLAIACVGASLLGACGGSGRQRTTTIVSERVDLRSPDVDARIDPARSGTVYVCPGARRVEVVFDPHGTVSIVGSGRPLVYGTVGTRAVNRACRSHGRLRAVPRGTFQVG